MDSTESRPRNHIHFKAQEDGGNIAYYNQDEACTTTLSVGYRTIGAIFGMRLRIEHLQAPCACTLSSKLFSAQRMGNAARSSLCVSPLGSLNV